MKGITKAIKRTPHLVTSKVGLSKKSTDPEFDDFKLKFTSMEETVEKMLKDCRLFNENVVSLFSSSAAFASNIVIIFQPIAGEYDLIGKHPACQDSIRNVPAFSAALEELKGAILPELELIERRVLAPTKELQAIMKQIRKSITKRDHKLVDYDRFNNSLTKLRDKKEKTLNDEKNLFKLEQDYEVATADYDNINTALKTELPRFMVQATQFIDPLFKSFFYMQLNIFYTTIQALNTFAQGKYDYEIISTQLSGDYEERRNEAMNEAENLNITKRILSTSKLVAQGRSVSGSSVTSSSNTTPRFGSHLSPSANSAGSGGFRVPSPSPSSPAASAASATPPPYSAGVGGVSTFEKKRAPPPPPVKPRPRAEPPVEYVVALYDFVPQAGGDLGFSAGDRIEVVQKTESAEDWWTGKLNGREGVFPANYVQGS